MHDDRAETTMDRQCPSTDLCNMPPLIQESLLTYKRQLVLFVLDTLPDAMTVQSDVHLITSTLSLLKGALDAYIPFTIPERVQLLNVLYPIVFTSKLPLSTTIAEICSVLLKLSPRMQRSDIQIDWVPLFDRLWEFTSSDLNAYDANGSVLFILHCKAIQCMSIDARRFFSSTVSKELQDRLLCNFTATDSHFFRVLGLLSIFLPFRLNDIADNSIDLITQLVGISSWVDQSIDVTCVCFEMFSRSARSQSFNWDSHCPALYNAFLQAMNLTIDGTGHPMKKPASQRRWHISSRHLRRRGSQQLLSKYMARFIIYTINASNIYLFKQLVSTISTFFHPSNPGSWTKALGSFLGYLSLNFAKRQNSNDLLANPIHSVLSEVVITQLLQMSNLAIYSKSQWMIGSACATFRRLAFIDSSLVTPCIYQLINRTLDVPTSARFRRVSCLRVLASTLAAMMDDPFLETALCLAADSIDPSTPEQTSEAIYLFTIFFQTKSVMGLGFLNDISHILLGRLLHLFEHFGEYRKETATDVEMNKDIIRLAYSFFCALPADILRSCSRRLLEFVNSRVIENARRPLGSMCSAAAFADPEWMIAVYVPDLEASLADTDISWMQWRIYLLSCIVRRTGSSLLPYMNTISSVIKTCNQHDHIAVRSYGNKLTRRVLKALTEIYPSELHPTISKIQSGSTQNLSISWHVPSKSEIQAASTLTVTVLEGPLDLLQNGVSSIDSDQSESVIRSLLVIYSVVRGASMVLGAFQIENDCIATDGTQSQCLSSDIFPHSHLPTLFPIMVGETSLRLLVRSVMLRILHIYSGLSRFTAVLERVGDILDIICRPSCPIVNESRSHRIKALLSRQLDVHDNGRCSLRPLLIEGADIALHRRLLLLCNVFKADEGNRAMLHGVIDILHLNFPNIYRSSVNIISTAIAAPLRKSIVDDLVNWTVAAIKSVDSSDYIRIRCLLCIFMFPGVKSYVCERKSTLLVSFIEVLLPYFQFQEKNIRSLAHFYFASYWSWLPPETASVTHPPTLDEPGIKVMESLSNRTNMECQSAIDLLLAQASNGKSQMIVSALLLLFWNSNIFIRSDSIVSVFLQNLISDDSAASALSILIIPRLFDEKTHKISINLSKPDNFQLSTTRGHSEANCAGYHRHAPGLCSPLLNSVSGEAYAYSDWLLGHLDAIYCSINVHRSVNGFDLRNVTDALLNIKSTWPSIRTPQPDSSKFSIAYVQLWHWMLLRSRTETPYMNLFRSSIFSGVSAEPEATITAIELFAALTLHCSRPTATNESTSCNELMTSLMAAIVSTNTESHPNWVACIRFLCSCTDTSKLCLQLGESLIELSFSENADHSTSTPLWCLYISLFNGILMEFGPRSIDLAHRALYRISNFYLSVGSKSVREAISLTIFHAISCCYPGFVNRSIQPSFFHHDQDPAVNDLAIRILKKSRDDNGSSRHCLKTAFRFIIVCFSYGDNIAFGSFILKIIVPVLNFGLLSSDAECCQSAMSAATSISWMTFPGSIINDLISSISQACNDSRSCRVRLQFLKMIRRLVPRHWYIVSDQTTESLFQILLELLTDQHVSIREAAATTLTAVYTSSNSSPSLPSISQLIDQFGCLCRTRLSPGNKEAVARRHGGVLGLIALVRGAAYAVPDWLPGVLSRLTAHSADPPPVGPQVKRLFIDWRHMHHDDWHELHVHFTSDELELVSQLDVASSYFV
uniref:Proteasome activator complex subunit 4 C-terminal domain-containing protein n=1 Tax=Spongospora subterranea TaxID=70186 RepID=A0A0H5QIQ9_9EUKA|eukprot:CRZ01970.1 hypothetical protein [Spongospora subterranea]